VNLNAIESVSDRRAGGTGSGVVRAEHEVVNKQLCAPAKQVRQQRASFVSIKAILLINGHPRQCLPPLRQFIAAPREILLSLEQLEPLGKPLLACSGPVHHSSPFG
jgi:hypothetical protein